MVFSFFLKTSLRVGHKRLLVFSINSFILFISCLSTHIFFPASFFLSNFKHSMKFRLQWSNVVVIFRIPSVSIPKSDALEEDLFPFIIALSLSIGQIISSSLSSLFSIKSSPIRALEKVIYPLKLVFILLIVLLLIWSRFHIFPPWAKN